MNRHLPSAERIKIHYCVLGGMGDRIIFQAIIRHAMANRKAGEMVIAVIPYHKDEYDARRYSPAPDEIWIVPEIGGPLSRALPVREAANTLYPDARAIDMTLYGYFDAVPVLPGMTCVDLYVRLAELREQGIYPQFSVDPGVGWRAKNVINSFHAGDRSPLIALHCRVLPKVSDKNLSFDCLLKLAERLKTTLGADLILVGGTEGVPPLLLDKMRHAAKADTSLQESAAFLSNCDLFIGGDSGPIHLAAAVGVPSILIRPETTVWKNGPFVAAGACRQYVGSADAGSGLMFDIGAVVTGAKEMLAASKKSVKAAPPLIESTVADGGVAAAAKYLELTVSYIIFNAAWASFIQRQGVTQNEQRDNAYRIKSSVDEYVNYLAASLATLRQTEPLANYQVCIYLVEIELNDFAQKLEQELLLRLPGLAFRLDIIRRSEIVHLIDWELRAPSRLHRSPNKIHEFAMYQAILRCTTRYLYLSDPDTLYFAPGYFDFAIQHMLKERKAVAAVIDMGRQITKDGQTFHMRKRMHTVSFFADVNFLLSRVDIAKDLSRQLDTEHRIDLIPGADARAYYAQYRQIDTLSFLTEHLTDPAGNGLLCELNGKFQYFHEGGSMAIVCDYFAHGHYRDQAVQIGLLNGARQSLVYRNLLKALNYVSMLRDGES